MGSRAQTARAGFTACTCARAFCPPANSPGTQTPAPGAVCEADSDQKRALRRPAAEALAAAGRGERGWIELPAGGTPHAFVPVAGVPVARTEADESSRAGDSPQHGLRVRLRQEQDSPTDQRAQEPAQTDETRPASADVVSDPPGGTREKPGGTRGKRGVDEPVF